MLLTQKEAAHQIRCSKTHLLNIIGGKVRDIPPLRIVRIGRRVLIRPDSLQSWIAEIEARNLEARKVEGLL